jgi:hypothetical protein
LLPSTFINVDESITVTDTPAVNNTSSGSDITVQPVDTTTGASPVTLIFTTVTQPGVTSLTTTAGGPPPPSGFQLGNPPVYYNLSTTAGYTGPVQICISYTGISFQTPPGPRLFHEENGSWVDKTTSVDTMNQIVCGSVTSFSPFALFQASAGAVNVSGQVRVTSTGLLFSRATGTFNGTLTVTNISAQNISGPIQIVLTKLPPGATLTNATRIFKGSPFVTVPGVTILAPNQSVTFVMRFANPAKASISFSPVIYSGSFQ